MHSAIFSIQSMIECSMTCIHVSTFCVRGFLNLTPYWEGSTYECHKYACLVSSQWLQGNIDADGTPCSDPWICFFLVRTACRANFRHMVSMFHLEMHHIPLVLFCHCYWGQNNTISHSKQPRPLAWISSVLLGLRNFHTSKHQQTSLDFSSYLSRIHVRRSWYRLRGFLWYLR